MTDLTKVRETTWEDALASDVLSAITPRIEPLVEKVADDFYERLMSSVQDYLSENVRFNIASRLRAAEQMAALYRGAHYPLLEACRAALATELNAAEVTGLRHPALVCQLEAAIAKAQPLSDQGAG